MEIEAKTKAAVKVLNDLKLNRRITVVTDGVNENALRAFANLPEVNVTTSDILNTYDLVVSDYVLVTKDAIKKIEEGSAEVVEVKYYSLAGLFVGNSLEELTTGIYVRHTTFSNNNVKVEKIFVE